MIIEEEEIKTEIKFSDKESDIINTPEQNWRNEEENQQDAYSLFSVDEENDDPNDLEIQSFSFDFENKKDESQSGNTFNNSFSEEKPVEFSFFVNEPTRNEPKNDFGQPKAEFNAPTSAVAEPAQKIETFYQKQEEPKAEIKSAFETKTEIETPKTEESEFTFVNKTIDQDRVIERRNKLKEFNSRYQSFDSTSEFESIPAFKRKNISIDGNNASDQNINTYLSDNNGSMQIRENRFLNKDVD